MKHVEACLSAREDRESSLHHCGGPFRLVQACLCAGKTSYRRFIFRGGTAKHVQACLSAREDRESSFHRCGGPLRFLQACLCAENPDKAVFTSQEVL